MANKAVIEYMKAKAKLEKETKMLVPEIYACFCKVLFEDCHLDAESIEKIFWKTQQLWTENIDRMDDMIAWCEESTGINLKGSDYV